jgi:GNAT superfamily N-acetyltransferase
VRIGPLDRSALPAATAVLAAACAFDPAAAVAEEKLFEPGARGAVQPLGCWLDDALVAVAAVAADRIRLLAVAPPARNRGIGEALLAACYAAARATGIATLRTLDQPGNFLAPGIDERNTDTIAWLERRGWRPQAEPRVNLWIDLHDNSRVSPERAAHAAARATAHGYAVRRAHPDEQPLIDAVAAEFGHAWPFEVARALGGDPTGVHVATRDGAYCGFAAHDGNNRGLGWFGPTGTWPAHRGHGLGEALLLACLVDIAAHHPRCEVAWIGPRPFYERVAGVAGDRRFVVLTRDLS